MEAYPASGIAPGIRGRCRCNMAETILLSKSKHADGESMAVQLRLSLSLIV